MAFSDSDILKMAASALAGGVIDSSGSQYYEKRNPWGIIVDPENVWADLPLLRGLPAATYQDALDNWQDNPNLIDTVGINPDGSYNDATAIRLTKVAGSNGTTYIAYNNYNDPSSGTRKNWLQPQLIPQASGAASAQYQARIFIGPPSNGNLLFSSAGFDGNWVSHFWSPALGLLMIAPSDKPVSAAIGGDDLYVCGFTYAGATGGGGGFSGNTVLLQDPDGKWRITCDGGALLSFDRYDEKPDGSSAWTTHANIGSSLTTDKVILTEPCAITTNLAPNSLDDPSLPPDYNNVFKVTSNDTFVYGDSDKQTVIDTKRDSDIHRAASLSEVTEFVAYPLDDKVIILDTLTLTADADKVYSTSWLTQVYFEKEMEFVNFIKQRMDVISCVDDSGVAVEVPMRFTVKDVTGTQTIVENISKESFAAGVNSGALFKEGSSHINDIQPDFTAKNGDWFTLSIEIPKGYKVEIKGGDYLLTDPTDNVEKTYTRPWLEFCLEYQNHVSIIDESNLVSKVHENTGVHLDNGIHSYIEGYHAEPSQLVGVGEHVTADAPILGNYLDSTYVATGTGGLFVLFQDDTTRTTLWTEGDRNRLTDNATPDYFIETKELTIDLNGIFDSEMKDKGWEVVNVEKLLPLIRYEGDLVQTYRVSVYSTVVNDYRFQENMTQFQFENNESSPEYTITPTIDATDPEYKQLKLPRKSFTVNNTTPRLVKFQFKEPVKSSLRDNVGVIADSGTIDAGVNWKIVVENGILKLQDNA